MGCDEDISDTEITSMMQGLSILTAARRQNKKLVKLSREITSRLAEASECCFLKLASCTVSQQPPLPDGFSWLLGRLADAEYSAFRNTRRHLLDAEGYFATTIVYERGHNGDKEHLLGVAQLTRPVSAQARWAVLEWKLKMQLAEAMLQKLDDELGTPALLFDESVAGRLRRQHEEETMSMLEACENESTDGINGLLEKQTPKNVIQQASCELQRLKQGGSVTNQQVRHHTQGGDESARAVQNDKVEEFEVV